MIAVSNIHQDTNVINKESFSHFLSLFLFKFLFLLCTITTILFVSSFFTQYSIQVLRPRHISINADMRMGWVKAKKLRSNIVHFSVGDVVNCTVVLQMDIEQPLRFEMFLVLYSINLISFVIFNLFFVYMRACVRNEVLEAMIVSFNRRYDPTPKTSVSATTAMNNCVKDNGLVAQNSDKQLEGFPEIICDLSYSKYTQPEDALIGKDEDFALIHSSRLHSKLRLHATIGQISDDKKGDHGSQFTASSVHGTHLVIHAVSSTCGTYKLSFKLQKRHQFGHANTFVRSGANVTSSKMSGQQNTNHSFEGGTWIFNVTPRACMLNEFILCEGKSKNKHKINGNHSTRKYTEDAYVDADQVQTVSSKYVKIGFFKMIGLQRV